MKKERTPLRERLERSLHFFAAAAKPTLLNIAFMTLGVWLVVVRMGWPFAAEMGAGASLLVAAALAATACFSMYLGIGILTLISPSLYVQNSIAAESITELSKEMAREAIFAEEKLAEIEYRDAAFADFLTCIDAQRGVRLFATEWYCEYLDGEFLLTDDSANIDDIAETLLTAAVSRIETGLGRDLAEAEVQQIAVNVELGYQQLVRDVGSY